VTTVHEPFDVIVAGGGPGGAVTAARLARLGRRVLVLERDDFPRFHLGESLLPASLPVLDAIGVREEVDARYIQKPGAVFHDSYTDRVARFDFREAFAPSPPFAYQVPRDDFDALLLSQASKEGAVVRHGWSVESLRFEGTRAIGVNATDRDGGLHAIDARFVVDATGRDALSAHARRDTARIRGDVLDNTALYAQWRGVRRKEGAEAGDFHLVVFGDDDPENKASPMPRLLGWFWVIPFKDGRTSVGAAASRRWMKRHAGGDPQSLYEKAIAETPVVQRFLDGAEQLWPARATADFSFRTEQRTGDGWLAVGDAGGFIDPLFSTGAHLAMHGGFHAADAIHGALGAGDLSRERFRDWEAEMRTGADLFLEMVESFYEGVLSRLFFVDAPHPYVRRVITSLLAGNVFDRDARWLRDARKRMARAELMKLLAGS
jgi:flavin-dependent dehydrogenase